MEIVINLTESEIKKLLDEVDMEYNPDDIDLEYYVSEAISIIINNLT